MGRTPSLAKLGAIGLVGEVMLHFTFFMWLHKSALSKSHGTPWMVFYQHTSPPCQVWWYRPCGGRDIKYSVLYMTSCDHVIRVVQLYYGLRDTIRQHPAKVWWSYVLWGRNIWFLVRSMTSCDQWVWRRCDLLSFFTSPWFTNFPNFVAKDLAKKDHVTL